MPLKLIQKIKKHPFVFQNVFGKQIIPETPEVREGLDKSQESSVLEEIQFITNALKEGREQGIKLFDDLDKQIISISDLFTPAEYQNIRNLREAAQKKAKQDELEAARVFIENLAVMIEEKETPDTIIEEKKDKAAKYLKNTTIPVKSAIDLKIKNPFIGTLNGPTTVNYESGDGSLDYGALQRQEALNGLPIYDKDGKPKIYEAIAPHGEQKLILYWIPDTDKKDFRGHFAIKGQPPSIHAFIGHNWQIREMPDEKEKESVRTEIENEKTRHAETEPEITEIRERLKNPAQKEKTVEALATALQKNVMQDQTEQLQRIMQKRDTEIPAKTSETAMIIETYFDYFEKLLTQQTGSLEEPTPTEKTEKHLEATTEAEQYMGTTTETPFEISEQASTSIIHELFKKIKNVLGRKIATPEEEQPTTEEVTESVEAVITLQEIFENLEEQETVSAAELMGETKEVKVESNLRRLKRRSETLIRVHQYLSFEEN